MITKVYLVGAGCGDTSLITQRGAELLSICDSVIYDRLASPTLLMYLKPGCRRVYVGKRSGSHSVCQEDINRILIEEAEKGGIIVRLKGGDPFVFGRGGEEILALEEKNIPYEVISGVTSAIAVPADAGIPVTHRGLSQSFHVITGHTADGEKTLTENYSVLAKLDGTLIFLMGLSNLSKIAERLIENGKCPDTPAAVISNGTTADCTEVRGKLSDIALLAKEKRISSPAITVIGAVAELNLKYDSKPVMCRKKIGVSGTRTFYGRLRDTLSELGADMIPVNVIETEEINKNQLDIEIDNISSYSWLCFTSPNGVKIFFDTLIKSGIDFRKISHIKFAVIGSSTAEALKKIGFNADIMPSVYTGKNLAYEITSKIAKNEKILILRSERGYKTLTDILEVNSYSFKDLHIYNTQSNKVFSEELTDNVSELDFIIFGSSYSAESFKENKNSERLIKKAKLIAIGTTTEDALKKCGYENIITADVFTAEGIRDILLSNL